MRAAMLLVAMGPPALARGGAILTCGLGPQTVIVEPRGAGSGLRLCDRVVAAQMPEPRGAGSIVAQPAMPDGGPVFLAVAAGAQGQSAVQARMTAVTRTATRLTSAEVSRTCIDKGL